MKEYQAKDDRIVIIDQTNQGVSIARNKGLEIAKGEYIGFVDPDDWVDSDFYETLYDKAIETNADIVKGNLKVIVNDKVTRTTTLYNDTIRNNKMLFYYYSCAAIFKKEKIKKNNVDFPIGLPLGEDLVFCVKMAFYANKIIVLDNVFYNYFQRHNSGSSIKRDKKRVDSYIYTHQIIINFINSINIPVIEYVAIFDRIIDELLRFCSDGGVINNGLEKKVLHQTLKIFNKCKYREVLLENFSNKFTYDFLKKNDSKGLYRYLKKSHKYQTKYNLKLFSFISLFKIKEYSDKDISIKRKFYIFSIPFLKIIRKDKKTYIKLFGFIPLVKIVNRIN